MRRRAWRVVTALRHDHDRTRAHAYDEAFVSGRGLGTGGALLVRALGRRLVAIPALHPLRSPTLGLRATAWRRALIGAAWALYRRRGGLADEATARLAWGSGRRARGRARDALRPSRPDALARALRFAPRQTYVRSRARAAAAAARVPRVCGRAPRAAATCRRFVGCRLRARATRGRRRRTLPQSGRGAPVARRGRARMSEDTACSLCAAARRAASEAVQDSSSKRVAWCARDVGGRRRVPSDLPG